MTHQEWIEDWLSKNHALGRCEEASKEMAAAFDDLTIVKGHVYCAWGKRGHWWLTTSDGTIVDPTASQFVALFSYEIWKPGDEIRIGKCMNCGAEIWESVQSIDRDYRKELCGEFCAREFEEYMNGDG